MFRIQPLPTGELNAKAASGSRVTGEKIGRDNGKSSEKKGIESKTTRKRRVNKATDDRGMVKTHASKDKNEIHTNLGG